MTYKINKAVVIGSGTMGGGIAAHLANAGVPVTLLDIVPNKLTEKEKKKGLTLKDKAVRNRIAQGGLDAAVKSRPASFFIKENVVLVTVGNLEDDFDVIAEADWIIEAIVENLEIKQSLMKRIDDVRREDTIISTNTSGLPLASISEGLSDGFKTHFLGTHFFNPPRYMRLLEIIPGPSAKPEVIDFISQFGEKRLGKGIVMCKDTPNFIANRIGSVGGAFALDYIMEHGFTVAEVDAITGPAMGRPKTATFRLLDLVGIDVANHVRGNLADLIPEDEVAQKVLNSEKANAVNNAVIEKGWLGRKSGVGFYKTVKNNGKKEYWTLNLETMEHEAPGEKPKFDSVGKTKGVKDPAKRLEIMLSGEDKAADLARAFVYHGLSYASYVIPEVANLPSAVDDAMRWGFMHDAGPFEVWDKLGVAETIKRIKKAGYQSAEWVDEMLESGKETFYQYEGETKVGVYRPDKKDYEAFAISPNQLRLQPLKDAGKLLKKNDSASIIDLGDGIACVEFHGKLNVLDADNLTIAAEALDRVESDYDGLVVTTEADNFSAGANLFVVVMMAQQKQWDELEVAMRALQDINMRMRYFSKPVVVAPSGLTLGGGAEIMMHASRVVAASELYTGLVEVGVGIIPAGGGTKEMMRRILNPAMRTENTDPLPFLERLFMQIGTAKVATSAKEALEFGMLNNSDRIIMNRDHLLAEAKREARHMADAGYVPPMREKIYAAGRDMLSALRVGIYMFRQGLSITEYDTVVANQLATVLTGGDISKPEWVDEQYILDLERQAMLTLMGNEETQKRMWHIMDTGKPLRN